MVRVNLQNAILLYLAWLGALCGALIVMLADVLPIPLTFVRPDNLFTCLTECQVFFVVLVWPLFIPSSVRGEPASSAESGRVRLLLLQVGLLTVLVLPPALMCANVSNASLGTFLRAQGLVTVLAAFVAALFAFALQRGWHVGPWYFLAAFIVSALLPFVHFVERELGRGLDLSFLAAVSPFWGASRPEGSPALVQLILYGALTLGLVVLSVALPGKPSPAGPLVAGTTPPAP